MFLLSSDIIENEGDMCCLGTGWFGNAFVNYTCMTITVDQAKPGDFGYWKGTFITKRFVSNKRNVERCA